MPGEPGGAPLVPVQLPEGSAPPVPGLSPALPGRFPRSPAAAFGWVSLRAAPTLDGFTAPRLIARY